MKNQIPYHTKCVSWPKDHFKAIHNVAREKTDEALEKGTLFVHVMGFFNVNISLESVDWLLSFTSEIMLVSSSLIYSAGPRLPFVKNVR